MKTNDAFWPISRQPAELVNRIDAYCRSKYMKRSEFTRQALVQYMEKIEREKKKK